MNRKDSKSKNKKRIFKIKNLNKNKKVVWGSLSVLLCLIVLTILAGKQFVPNKVSGFIPGKEVALKDQAIGLDFSDFKLVETHDVPNAKETVIYIPQIHKDPTTGPEDPKNDMAVKVQTEITGMLNTLVNNHHIVNVMDETDLYGPMPQDKIDKLKTGLQNITDTRQSVDKMLKAYIADGGSQQEADQIRAASEAKISTYQRNIYLTGGAAVLAATNPNAHVYGSQDEATLDEAKKELQNIVYLEARISQLQQSQQTGTQTSATSSATAGNSQTQQILSMLSGSSGGSTSNASLTPIITLAQSKQDTNLQNDITDAKSKVDNLSPDASFETSNVTSNVPEADINNNPYANETDLAKLQQEDTDATAQFMKVAKDQRSQEVCDNIADMMQKNNATSSVLVLGAEHKDEVVSDLNAKGINVIVLTPESEQGVNLGS